MKKVIIVAFSLWILCVEILAYTVPSGTIVYVTPTGSKYHRQNCSYTTTVKSVTIEQAERSGYGACSRCNPDVLTGVYGSPSSVPKQQDSAKPYKSQSIEVNEKEEKPAKIYINNDQWIGGKIVSFLFLYLFIDIGATILITFAVLLLLMLFDYLFQFQGFFVNLGLKSFPLICIAIHYFAYKYGIITKWLAISWCAMSIAYVVFIFWGLKPKK